MPPQETTGRQLDAFRRFLGLMPYGKDVELVILKSHLLIEEQVRQIIDERLKNPKALHGAELDCHQAICLAQSFFDEAHDPSLWPAIKKLNKIRNDIAHNLEPKGLHDRLQDLIASFPTGSSELPEEGVLEMTLLSLFVAVSDLVEKPVARVVELVPRNES